MKSANYIPNSALRTSNYALLRRGSVLVMVVGLLTMIALLGTTFLLISRLDRRTAEALAKNTPADPVAKGLVAQIQALLKEGLRISDNGTPTVYTDDRVYGTASVDQYMDYPHSSINAWLSSTEYETGPPIVWPHITYLSGSTGAPADYNNVNFSNLPTGFNLVDTDGNDAVDSNLFPTGVTNVAGQEYWAAVRIVDLSSMLNINIASTPTGASGTMPDYRCPVFLDLDSYLTTTVYEDINEERCGGTSQTPQNVNTNIAQLFFASPTPYRPFSIGDEIFLRWLNTGMVQTGRIYDAIPGADSIQKETNFPQVRHQNVTTYNCSRNLPRHAVTNVTVLPAVYNNGTVLNDDATNGPDKRQFLQNAFQAMLIGGGASNPERKAAHLVANIWAYLDGYNAGRTYQVNYTEGGSTYCAYGVISQQPVISEVFVRHLDDPNFDGNPEDGYWGIAIEIYNPTPTNVHLYLMGADGTTVFADLGDISNGYTVIYNLGYDNTFYPGGDTAVIPHAFPGIDTTGWHKVANMTLRAADASIRIARLVTVGTDNYYIPVDEIASANPQLNYFQPPPKAIEMVDLQRDTDATRQRYNVAEYVSGLPIALNADNLVTTDNMSPTADVFVGFNIPSSSAVTEFEQLRNVYLAGPRRRLSSGAVAEFGHALPDELVQYKTEVSRGRAATTTPLAGGAEYPNIAVGALLQELFGIIPPDTTHGGTDSANVYGRININTATRAALRRLPWPSSVGGTAIRNDSDPDNSAVDEVGAIIEYIIAYRDRSQANRDGDKNGTVSDTTPVDAGVNYSHLDGLATINGYGFKTPGELAIPLAQYITDKGLLPAASADNYMAVHDALYNAVANLVTVNSDTYAAYIYVMIPDGPDVDTNPEYEARYLAVFDRSNCRTTNEQPAVLLFTPIK